MSLDQLVEAAMLLPASEKALLAESLWESLGDPFQAPLDETDAITLAAQRDREIESGAVKPLKHEDLMRRLLGED